MTAIDVYVESGALTRQHDAVVAIAADLIGPRGAAASVRLDRGAYGLFCAAIPVMLDQLSEVVGAAMGAVAGDVTELARRVGQVAEAYRAADFFSDPS
jgi:hypothetical protein